MMEATVDGVEYVTAPEQGDVCQGCVADSKELFITPLCRKLSKCGDGIIWIVKEKANG